MTLPGGFSVKGRGFLGIFGGVAVVFLALQVLGVYVLWRVVGGQETLVAAIATQTSIIATMNTNWVGAVQQNSLEHRQLVESVGALAYIYSLDPKQKAGLNLQEPEAVRRMRRAPH